MIVYSHEWKAYWPVMRITWNRHEGFLLQWINEHGTRFTTGIKIETIGL